jgi:hypothetical protein
MLRKLILAVALIAAPVGARDIYVSPKGADTNSGLTAAAPLATIQAAMYKTLPGDTVRIGAGTYAKAVWISRAGTPAAKITYTCDANARITTDHKSVYLFDIAAPYNRIVNCDVSGGADQITYAQALAQYFPAKGPQSGDAWAAMNQYCITVHAPHVQVASNHVHDCPGAGIYAQDTDDISIGGNTVERSAWWSSGDTSAIDFHYGKSPTDGTKAVGVTIYSNIIRQSANAIPFWSDPAGTKPTDGNGIIVDLAQGHDKSYTGVVTITGNVVSDSGGSGIRAYGSAHVVMIRNTVTGSNSFCPASAVAAGADCGGQNNGELTFNTSSSGQMIGNTATAPASTKRAAFVYASTGIVESANTFKGVVELRGMTVSPTDVVKP